MKRAGVPHRYLEGKNIVLLVPEDLHAYPLRLRGRRHGPRHGRDLPRSGSAPRWARRSPSRTPPAFSAACTTASSSAALPRTDVEELAAKSGVPVWNGLTTEWHPTQMLADILTVQENFNYDIKGKTLVFMGDCKQQRGSLPHGRLLQARHELRGLRPRRSACPPTSVIEACKPIAPRPTAAPSS